MTVLIFCSNCEEDDLVSVGNHEWTCPSCGTAHHYIVDWSYEGPYLERSWKQGE